MKSKDPIANGPMKSQKVADCFFKGPQRAFRHVLHRCGLTREQAKELKFAMRLLVIERCIADLRACAPNDDLHVETDLYILDIYCRQVARHARAGIVCGLYQKLESQRTIAITLRALQHQMGVIKLLYVQRLVQPPLRIQARLSDRTQCRAAAAALCC
eukprot:7242272-Prymnesium_polylepis.2